MIIWEPVQTAEKRVRAVGALRVEVAVQTAATGSYCAARVPFQMSIRLPVQKEAGLSPVGALVVEVADQLLVAGSYTPPVVKLVELSFPPQTIILLPVQTAPCWKRAEGLPVSLYELQVSVAGLYFKGEVKGEL